MKKASRRIVNNIDQSDSGKGQRTARVERTSHPTSWLKLSGRVVAVAIAIAVVLGIALLIAPRLFVAPSAQAQNVQNMGSPAFNNPSEIRYRANENRLRGVMKLISGNYQIPNVGMAQLRQYRGWDPATSPPGFGINIAPGPTLRARLGDKVEIAFLNEIDDSQFSYTFDTATKPGAGSSYGCDQSGTVYPGADVFPDCFHGSSTANIHFHGTHTSPDGLGDNVLVQVLPQPKQPDWSADFDKMYNSGKIPQKWADMPLHYRTVQAQLVAEHDAAAAALAKKNGLAPPESLAAKNMELIHSGQWPEYIIGAFPNFFPIPDYDKCKDLKPIPCKAGQSPGTHWYHAHKHGSTSLHMRNGLAGAFVIESTQPGGYDQVIRQYYGWKDASGKEVYGNHEKILVFQQFDPIQNLERGAGTGKGSTQVLVNGTLSPTISMAPGEVQLWRLVNATQGNDPGVIGTDLWKGGVIGNSPSAGKDPKKFNLMQTAADGVQFSQDNYNNQPFLSEAVPKGLELASGNRADLLMQAPQAPGVYSFTYLFGPKHNITATLFFVEVKVPAPGQSSPTVPSPAFPTKQGWAQLPKFLYDLPAPDPKDFPNTLAFQWENLRVGPGPKPYPPHFMINNKQFGATGDIVDQCMPQDGLQDWVLENYTSAIAHPFHIHINPFQVVEIDTPIAPGPGKPPFYEKYAPPGGFVWQDVIAIPPAVIVPSKDGKTPPQITPGKVRIRQTFLDFPGTFVLHCHILAHEDRGMMQLVRVVPAKSYPNGCQGTIPAHH